MQPATPFHKRRKKFLRKLLASLSSKLPKTRQRPKSPVSQHQTKQSPIQRLVKRPKLSQRKVLFRVSQRNQLSSKRHKLTRALSLLRPDNKEQRDFTTSLLRKSKSVKRPKKPCLTKLNRGPRLLDRKKNYLQAEKTSSAE